MTKKALLVGINSYKKAPLRGCVNDANAMRTILKELFGFHSSNIKVLFDHAATSSAIRKGIAQLVSSASNGDTVVFFFAGHGAQIGIGAPDEADEKDETIVPVDMSYKNLISDNYIYENLVRPFEDKNASLTAIFDCCHSGTILRDVTFDPITGEPVVEVLNRCLPDFFLIDQLTTRSLGLAMPVNGLSACKDDETAADLRNVNGTGVARGAFSYAFHKLIKARPDITYGEIEDRILDEIRLVSPKHKQTPQLQLVDAEQGVFT